MTTHDASLTRRSFLSGLAITAVLAAMPWRPAAAGIAGDTSATIPIAQLNNALLAVMKAASRTSFEDRYRQLTPVIQQVFNLDAILAASIGLSWATLPASQKADLATAFRRYTVSSYVANFNSYNGQSFQIDPSVRTLGANEVVVQTHLVRVNQSPIALDYVMRQGPAGWQAVDVLSDGTISRVAVQRSDFRALLRSGGVPALTAGLDRKYADLSGDLPG
jgi:phospholipid transport system substrate-binding protein